MLRHLLRGMVGDDNGLEDLEGLLQGALVEVAPRQDFVKSLDQRLVHADAAPEIQPALSIGRWDQLLAVLGVLGGVLVLVVGLWIIIARLAPKLRSARSA